MHSHQLLAASGKMGGCAEDKCKAPPHPQQPALIEASGAGRVPGLCQAKLKGEAGLFWPSINAFLLWEAQPRRSQPRGSQPIL